MAETFLFKKTLFRKNEVKDVNGRLTEVNFTAYDDITGEDEQDAFEKLIGTDKQYNRQPYSAPPVRIQTRMTQAQADDLNNGQLGSALVNPYLVLWLKEGDSAPGPITL